MLTHKLQLYFDHQNWIGIDTRQSKINQKERKRETLKVCHQRTILPRSEFLQVENDSLSESEGLDTKAIYYGSKSKDPGPDLFCFMDLHKEESKGEDQEIKLDFGPKRRLPMPRPVSD